MSDNNQIKHTFTEGLISDGPADEYKEKLMLYGQFVGDWIAETKEYSEKGIIKTEWDIRFEWILEGRAIQDLWITPIRKKERVNWEDPGNRYSTTLRIYDPKIDAWHILWINPPNGRIVRQLGKTIDNEIVQISDVTETGEIMRWVYRDIKKDSFRWCNETSIDQGKTWKLTQEMLAERSK
jgi:hypothetical protein